MERKPPRKRLRKLPRVVLSVAVSASVLSAIAGCGGGAAPATAKPGHLVIYAAEGYDQAMANAFQQKTGIKVELSDMSTGPLIAKIQAEKSNPRWDVAWFDGDGPMYELDQQGLLLRGWQPANIKNYSALGKRLMSPDQSYIPTGVTAAGAIAYNTKLLTPSQAPKHWSDLLKPEFKGAVAMNNPAISGPTFPIVAGFLYRMGISKGKQFFAQLKANGLHIYPTNKPTLSALSTGVVKVAIAQDSAEIQAIQKGSSLKIVYPAGGVTMLPGALGIDKHAPDMAVAKAFANFVLSPAGQQIMLTKGGGDSNFNPIVKGEQPNPSRQQSGINWERVPVQWQAKNYNTIQSWFKDSIAG